MSGHRIERITEDIKRELTAIFREVKDPRVAKKLISILKVEVSGDLSYCKVYISSINGLKEADEAVLGLKSASGYVRHELGQKLKLRHVPLPIFIATDSIEHGADIFKKLNELKEL